MAPLYQLIAQNIESKIHTNVLRTGDKLPSIREICRKQGVSMSTALEAYYLLEGKGLIESRPKSGFFVSAFVSKKISVPDVSSPGNNANYSQTEAVFDRVFSSFHSKESVLFSVGVPANEFLPVARLNKAVVHAMREIPGSGTQYESVQGNERLRRQIARMSMHWGGNLTADDIVITSGCMDAICLCLMVLAERGDTIAVESPVYFGVLQLAQSLGIHVVELPTNPVTGIDLDALNKLIKAKKIKVVFLMSNFNNPLGSCMPDAKKQELVELLLKYDIPLIEDDIYADLYFGNHRPKSCKTFDVSSNVLWCGSVSKTLAPGYRIGWVAPGKHKKKIIRQKLFNSVSAPSVLQYAIATFFESGRYENHLRKLRNVLYANQLQMARTIVQYFPETLKLSRPQGGFMLWLELAKHMNTALIIDELEQNKISIAPGRMFTLQDQYHNCMRLSYGLAWTPQVENALIKIGELCK